MSKIPTILCLVIFSITLLAQSECFVTKKFLKNIVINPIKNLVSPNETEEHGNLAGAGRDLIKDTAKTITYIKKGIKKTFSKITAGLDCDRSLSEGNIDTFKTKVQAIYPGTKWCGDGNISRSIDDLGKFSTTDSCCRDHDLCPVNIPADEEKYGLTNTGLFTRSECECDRRFYNCLKNAKNLVADSIGYSYFTILGPQCFQQDYPIEDCEAERKGRCVNYVTNTNGEKRYQWFDNPAF